MRTRYLPIIIIGITFSSELFSGEPDSNSTNIGSSSRFTITFKIPTTPIKNQYSTSTCWSFSTLSMFESELLKTQNKEYNLSEMFVVRKTYENKAEKYLRMHGTINFSAGGEPNDVTTIFKDVGLLPEEAFSGLLYDSIGHMHVELDKSLKNYMNSIVQKEDLRDQHEWKEKYSELMDKYLGKVPEKFSYQGIEYNATTFARSLGIDPDNYILLTSFTHHPYYTRFILEVPDNWSWGEAYNLPLDDFMRVVNYSIENLYSLTWSTDISEPGFNFERGIARVPKIIYEPESKVQQRNFAKKSQLQKDAFIFDSITSANELVVTEQNRQKAFDTYATTDDHAMNVVGKATDNNGDNYFYVKNSWGTENKYQGYMFISEAYFRYKTILIMVNKNAIPEDIRTRMEPGQKELVK